MSINVQANDQAKRQENINKDAQLQILLSKTPQQVDDWIETNVSNLTDVKLMLKRMSRLMIYLAKKSK